ncbi:Ppx/GppA family phosphatase [Rhizobium sp. SG2393]|uniref:Ppx/GppA family phosphatase n=1 Tax=Rhizobium sp. SG2393 TaxID=3276279 RepID=UPI0036703133
MVESEAQGRLRGIAPVAVVDIGSNSIRLVVYEGLSRTPAVLFNEKVMCGLGKGIDATGRMDEDSVERAIVALHRFKALAVQARAHTLYVLATAAARDASNGPDFIHRAEAILQEKVRVLSGEEEAYFSALGVISGHHHPDGIVGDMGGGSLELADVRERAIGTGITLPLGGIRLSEHCGGSVTKARSYVRSFTAGNPILANAEGRTFYAVGGTWRAIAKLHMDITSYPLHMMQGYEVAQPEMMAFLEDIILQKHVRAPAYAAISKSRRSLMPFGVVALQEVLGEMKAGRVSFSALGVREGYLYSLLADDERALDPLLTAAEDLAILRARSPEHARELAEWSGHALRFFDVEESEEEARYRQAACLLADISWRAHPDYRGLQALNLIAHGTFSGISHPGRAYIALANYFRFEGVRDDDATAEIATITTPRFIELAKLLGALLRVVYVLSASMPGIVRNVIVRPSRQPDFDLEFVIPANRADLAGERLDGRLQQLSKLTGKRLTAVFE